MHTENDRIYRRNRKHLRKSNESPYFSSASEDFPSQLMNEPLIIPRDQIQNRSPRKENTDKITPQENANIGEPRRSARERRKFTPYVHIP